MSGGGWQALGVGIFMVFFFFIFVHYNFCYIFMFEFIVLGVQAGNYTGPVSANLTVRFKRTYNSKLSMF
jgi:hypothetical protein